MYEEIIAEIERQKQINRESLLEEHISVDVFRVRMQTLNHFATFIESLPEEKPSEDLEKEIEFIVMCEKFINFKVRHDLIQYIARHFAQWGAEHPRKVAPSEDLEKAAGEYIVPWLDKAYEKYGLPRQKSLSKFDAYDMEEAFEAGAQWQKEQMIPVTALVNESKDFLSLSLSTEEYAKIGRRFKGGDDIEIYIKQDKK